MSSWKDEICFSTVLAATDMLSRLEGFSEGAAGGGEVDLFWSLLVFRSLVPFSVNGRPELAVADSVGVRGARDKLSLH